MSNYIILFCVNVIMYPCPILGDGLVKRPQVSAFPHKSSSNEQNYFIFYENVNFGNRCLSAIGGGKQRSRLAGWMQLSAEATPPAPGPHGVPASATLCAQRIQHR